MNPLPYTPHSRDSGLDVTTPGLVIYGIEKGPTVAIQNGTPMLTDGRPLPDDVQELERMRFPMSRELRRDLTRLKAEKVIAAERQASEARIRALAEEEERRLDEAYKQQVEIENSKFTLPDLPSGSPFGGGF